MTAPAIPAADTGLPDAKTELINIAKRLNSYNRKRLLALARAFEWCDQNGGEPTREMVERESAALGVEQTPECLARFPNEGAVP